MNILINSHKVNSGPDDDLLIFFLRKKVSNIAYVTHDFSSAKTRISKIKLYKRGKLYKEISSNNFFLLPESIIYLKEFYFTLKALYYINFKCNLYISLDGLLSFFGIFLKKIFTINKVVYWSIDLVPHKRFKSGFKNFLYKSINKYSFINSDENWDLSPRMMPARINLYNLEGNLKGKYRIVPYGIWSDRINFVDFNNCDKTTLVFMGHIHKSSGVQNVIKAIPIITKKVKNFKFKIIGDGPYVEFLKALAIEYKVFQNCIFMGRIDDIKVLEVEICKSALSIAPYIFDKTSFVFYADPGKIKTYLGCGVPVLCPNISWNCKEIYEAQCGLEINTKPNDIAKKIIKLLLDEKKLKLYRDRAKNYSSNFNYERIFSFLR
jgi:glycosyltransferase involved in cell wall biosynthesis